MKKGFSTLELLIAMAVLTMSFSAVVLISFSNQSLMADSDNSNDALNKAQSLLEDTKNLAKINFDSVENTTQTDGIFTKDLIVTELDAITKKITAQVSWQNGQKKVDLYNIIANLSNGPGADTCSFALSGDWSHPEVHTFALASLWAAELPAQSNGIYTITDLDAYLGKLYITADSTGSPGAVVTQKTFFVLNLADPSNPTLLGKADNDPATISGLAAVRTSQQYSYAASSIASNGQLQIFDITSNPPRRIENFQVPSTSVGSSIFYKNGYVYLGLSNDAAGPEFFIINVSNPTSPTVVGSAEIGGTVNDIYVHKNFAYVASSNGQNIKVFNITAPTENMDVAGSYSSGSNHGKRLSVLGDTIYLGKTTGTNEFYILNGTNINNITSQGSINFGTPTDINGMEIRSNLAFFATAAGNMQIWNITDPENPVVFANPSVNLGNPAKDLDCEGNYIYVASNDGSGRGYISAITAH